MQKQQIFMVTEHSLKKELLSKSKSLESFKQKTQPYPCMNKNRFSAVHHKHFDAQSLKSYQVLQQPQKEWFQQQLNIQKLQHKLICLQQTLRDFKFKQSFNYEKRTHNLQQLKALTKTNKEQQNAQLTKIKYKKGQEILEENKLINQQIIVLHEQEQKLKQQINELQIQIARLNLESRRRQLEKYKRPASSIVENPKTDQKSSKLKLKQIHKYLTKCRSDNLKVENRPCLKMDSKLQEINQRISIYQQILQDAKQQKIKNQIRRNKVQQSIKTSKENMMNQKDEEKIQSYKESIQFNLSFLNMFQMKDLEKRIQNAKERLNNLKKGKKNIIINYLMKDNLEKPYDPKTFYKAQLSKIQGKYTARY